ncbi:glycoside hydrolase family 27 protein [Alkalibacterium sp. f15]|uniref:glycoside hydrolase family 27 protein n=1 Tax=Alkalibacterium sp. f15 TaxID=3414029 RepID=UPI003BF8EB87
MYAFRDWAKTPPKGWNSWDSYGASVTEKEVRHNAEYMSRHLKEYGWEYVVVDIQWYEPAANSSRYHAYTDLEMDEYSRLRPAANRFPSSEADQSFKPLSDHVHSLGLKFGIHIMRGIPRQAVHRNSKIKGIDLRARDIVQPNSICPWNTDMYGIDTTKPGAKAYYQSLVELYADWGVDFIKVDDIADSKLYGAHLNEIALLREVIDESGRDIVLSLSPGPASLEHGTFLQKHANMWRLTDDYWDSWSQLRDMFDRCEKWAPFVGEGTWPDCDMLPMGHIGLRSVDGSGSDRMTRFTRDEQKAMLTLWSLFRSPLFFGGELTDLDEWTLDLLQNESLIEIHANGKYPAEVYRDKDFIVWKTQTDSNEWLAVFNISGEDRLFDRDIGYSLDGDNKTIGEVLDSKEIYNWEVNTVITTHGVKLFKF